jgi:peptidoglycan/LPS O-acetylase OafA/YrhL
VLFVQKEMVDVTWGQVALNLLMFQDLSWIKPNVIVGPLFGNSPLWSLSYEWWFYILYFPIVRWVPKSNSGLVYSLGLLAALSYVMFPNFLNRELMYFVIWWSGVVLARLYLDKEGIKLVRLFPVLSVLLGISVILGANAYLNYTGKGVGLSPVLELRHFLFSIVALLAALGWRSAGWFMFDQLLGWGIRLAPISYGVYISHYFMVSNATYLDGILPASFIIRFLVYMTVCLGFSYLVERVIYTKIKNAYLRASLARKTFLGH